VIAAALVGHTSRMLLGAPVDSPVPVAAAVAPAAAGAPVAPVAAVAPVAGGASARPPRRRWGADTFALLGALVTCAVLGLTLGPLGPLLDQATTVVTGTP
jgi:hydrogenase-4 component F